MPLYNKGLYVRRAVESVVGQSFTDWELVVVDDGSTDGGGDAVVAVGDPRVRLRRQENAGVSAARNRGVAASDSGCQYICFLDADDWWEPTFLEEMAGLTRRYPEAGIYGTGYYIVKNGKRRVAPIGVEDGFTEGEINYCRVYAKTLCMPLTSISVCVRREVFEEMGGFPEGIAMGEDFLLWMQIALKHKVVLLNRPLSYYNQDVENTSRGIGRSYEPSRFMTFHFSKFAEAERKDADVKRLLDNLRVYTLMRFRRHNRCADEVRREIAQVDFANVPPIYRFYYKAPYWLVASYLWMKETAVKQRI